MIIKYDELMKKWNNKTSNEIISEIEGEIKQEQLDRIKELTGDIYSRYLYATRYLKEINSYHYSNNSSVETVNKFLDEIIEKEEFLQRIDKIY